MKKQKIGIVLSGGGAKGAYQVGVIKALSEYDVQIDMISGASIGALNGAVLASADSFKEGAYKLEALWKGICTETILKVNSSVLPLSFLKIFLSVGLDLGSIKYLSKLERIYKAANNIDISIFKDAAKEIINTNENALLSSEPIKNIINSMVSIDHLASGIPFFVSIYESEGSIFDLSKVGLSCLGLYDTKESEFIKVNNLSKDAAVDIILASASIPVLFSSKKVNGKKYHDGGIGGSRHIQGNTPITPLIENGCDFVIVTHLSDGSLWNRHDFPDTTILEIRPQNLIKRKGPVKDMFAFEPETIQSWIQQGYEDAKIGLKNVIDPVNAEKELKFSEQLVLESIETANETNRLMVNKMKELKQIDNIK